MFLAYHISSYAIKSLSLGIINSLAKETYIGNCNFLKSEVSLLEALEYGKYVLTLSL